MIKYKTFMALLFLSAMPVFSQKVSVVSPNNRITVDLINRQNTDSGEWFLKVSYNDKNTTSTVIPEIVLGLIRSDQDFSKDLKLLKTGKQVLINERYNLLHGKRSDCSNSANETIVFFENSQKAKLNLIIRAYNDGIAFRYEFPDKEGSFIVRDELTSYNIPATAKRWLEKWNTANEGLYSVMNDDNTQQSWCYPALFDSPDNDCWFLLHEADVDRNY